MHTPRLRVLFPFLFSVVFLSSASALAATLSGRVVDSQGAAIPGVRVVVSSTTMGTVAEQRSDDRGAFTITALPDGTYDVRGFADGFHSDVQPIRVGGNQPSTITLTLRVSPITDAIVVSASHVDVPLSRAPDSVSVVTASDLQSHQVESVADALRLVPGLDVTRSGSRGAITSLFPRGGGSNYTLVLIDGVRANAFGGGFDFGHLPVADVDRIEVVRGPESAVFGSDAIGAVVQIVTKRGGPLHGDAVVEGGNQATERVGASVAGSSGRWTFGGGVDQSRTDGYTGLAPATGERVSNDDDHLRRASASAGWHNPEGVDVAVSGSLGHDDRGFPGPFGSDPIGAFSGVDRVARGINDTRQVGVRASHPWSSTVRQEIDASVFDLSSAFKSASGDSTSGTRRIEARVREDAAFNASFGASAGVDILRERGTSTYITGLSDDQLPIQRTVTGTFGELRYVARERLFVTAGIRVDRLTRDAVEANVGAFTSRPAFPEQSITSANPKVAASYAVGGTRLHASAGTGIRPPDAFEIAFTDNPNLKPERSRSIDIGVDQHVAGDTVVLGATAFFNQYDDLLVTVGRALQDASRYQTDNISNARARGVELTADARPVRRLLVRGHYTFLSSEILAVDTLRTAPPPFVVGDPLLRRPRHQGAISVAWTSDRITLFGDVTTRAQTLDVEPNDGAFGGLFYAPGYAVANLGGAIRVRRGVEVTARVLNVTDKFYEEALGFPALRRSSVFGVRVAASR